MRKKSIVSLRKENLFLPLLTDEEISEIERSSLKYQENELFKTAIDSEHAYRIKQKTE